MQISPNKVVEIHYTLTNKDGQQLDQSPQEKPLAYLHGANNIIPGLEQALEGKAEGEKLQVEIAPEEAYGPRHDGLVQELPRNMFDQVPELVVGMQLQASSDEGTHTVTVREIKDEAVVIDANHPLAGETLNFDVEVASVRDASEEEVEHGHVHDENTEH